MQTTKLADGTVHKMLRDFEKTILTNKVGKNMWLDVTPLARNESIYKGMRTPYCWAGCTHRKNLGK